MLRIAPSQVRPTTLSTVVKIIVWSAITWGSLELSLRFFGRPVAWTIATIILVVVGFALFQGRKKIGR